MSVAVAALALGWFAPRKEVGPLPPVAEVTGGKAEQEPPAEAARDWLEAGREVGYIGAVEVSVTAAAWKAVRAKLLDTGAEVDGPDPVFAVQGSNPVR